MQKYTLKERKKNGVTIRLTGKEWNKISTLQDGEWTTHSKQGEAIGVRYGCTIHIHKDGLSGEFDWSDLNCIDWSNLKCIKESPEYSKLASVIDVAINVAVVAAAAASIVVLLLN